MENALGIFFIGSLIVLVLMGTLTKSISGAFLGLAVVYLSTALMLANQGGLYFVGALGIGSIGLICLILAFGLGFNYSRSTLSRLSPSGERWDASQTTIGEGATRVPKSWNVPESLPSGESHQVTKYDN